MIPEDGQLLCSPCNSPLRPLPLPTARRDALLPSAAPLNLCLASSLHHDVSRRYSISKHSIKACCHRQAEYSPNCALVKATSWPSVRSGSARGPNTRTCVAVGAENVHEAGHLWQLVAQPRSRHLRLPTGSLCGAATRTTFFPCASVQHTAALPVHSQQLVWFGTPLAASTRARCATRSTAQHAQRMLTWRRCVSRPFWWLASTATCSRKPLRYALQTQ